MGGWDGAAAPVGIFWTSGRDVELTLYDHLTNTSMDEIGNENLECLGRKSTRSPLTPLDHHIRPVHPIDRVNDLTFIL
jgi:hypothetical protein